MDADRLRLLRLRYLLAIGLPAAAACQEALPASGATTTQASASASSSNESEPARAPEFESKSIAPLMYAGKDCPTSLTRCMPGQVGGGYEGAFPECAPDYSGEYFNRSRLSVHETRKARRTEPNVCCYRVERGCNYDMPVVGRVLRDHGAPRVAPTTKRGGWEAAVSALRVPDEATRARLVEHWTREAAAEHASIAAFSLVSLQLLAFAAPAALVEAAHDAALDEVEHARLSFAIASHSARAPIGPAALAVPTSCEITLERFAVETLVDGCLGETVAALVARESAARCTDAAIARVLLQIGDDEERHAELAFRLISWAIGVDPRCAAAVRRALDDQALSGAREVAGPLDAFGAITDDARAFVRDRALSHVVRPCLFALLGTTGP